MPCLAKPQDMMIELVELKMDFVFALLLKSRQVNDFFMNDFEIVFLIELKNADPEEVRVQVNSKNSILEEVSELLLFLNNSFIIADVDLVFLQLECNGNLLLRCQEQKLLENILSFVTLLLNDLKIKMLFSTSFVDDLAALSVYLEEPVPFCWSFSF